MGGFLAIVFLAFAFVMLPGFIATQVRKHHWRTYHWITDRDLMRLRRGLNHIWRTDVELLTIRYGPENTQRYIDACNEYHAQVAANNEAQRLITEIPPFVPDDVIRQNLSEREARLVYGNDAVNHYITFCVHHTGKVMWPHD
jgi:hypothetical protein